MPNKKTSAAPPSSVAPQPFLKWAGGKTQLLPQFNEFFPLEINRYFEPFVGGGAVFFYLKHRFPKMKAFLRDINPDLINAYCAVRDDPPYYPVSSTANFTSYSKDDFDEGKQQELHAVSADAARRNVRVMLSNSDVPFIQKLYADFAIHVVRARRAINRDGSKRGLVNELVITNKLEEQLLLMEGNHQKENEHDKTMVNPV